MSVNYNRKQLNKFLNPREYRLRKLKEEYSYCLICCKRSGSFYYSCHPSDVQSKHRHGNGKHLSGHDIRKYRTWKYNRKTQWKS